MKSRLFLIPIFIIFSLCLISSYNFGGTGEYGLYKETETPINYSIIQTNSSYFWGDYFYSNYDMDAILDYENTKLSKSGDTATGDYNFDSNTFVIDSTNNRVGIGTASPSYPLEVSGAGTVQALIQSTSGSVGFLLDRKASTDKSYIGFRDSGDSSTEWFMGKLDVTGHKFGINYNYNQLGNKFVIDTTGNVGIGTASPTRTLDVNGESIFQNNMRLKKALEIDRQGAPGNYHYLNSPANDLIIGISGSANDFIIKTANAAIERFRIEGDTGKVGIGTTSPSDTFHVHNGRIRVTDNSNSELKLYDESGSPSGWVFSADTDDTDRLDFVEIKNGATQGARMTILQGGKVGIGTTTPSEQLDVTGRIKSTLGFGVGSPASSTRFYGADTHAGTNMYGFYDTGTYSLSAAATEIISFRQAALTINTNNKNLTYYKGLEISNPTKLDSGTITNTYGLYINPITIGTNNYGAYIGGKVGIGTASPSYPLEVNANVSGISIYSQANISATGYNTRTSVFDPSKGNAFDFIKDSSYYKTLIGEINHSKFYGYAGEVTTTDYSRPEIIKKIDENCTTISAEYDKEGNIIKEEKTICNPFEYEETTYPYNKIESQVSLNAEIDVLRQAVYELNERVKYLEELLRK